jgi:hypothetical protein
MVVKETGLTRPEIYRAVGWLARENKVEFTRDGGKQVLRLNGEETH